MSDSAASPVPAAPAPVESAGTRPLVWILLALVVLAIPVTAYLLQSKSKESAKAPPPLATLPGFTLTNQDGRTVSLDEFKNRVWVANFVFTSCMGACPILTQKMAGVQAWVAGEEKKDGRPWPVSFASFTVDPKTDTPEKLHEYGVKYGADFSRWYFLTGNLPLVEQTIVKGFRMSMDAGMGGEDGDRDAPSFDKTYDIMHGERFVLVDGQGRIRGYYVTDRDGLGRLGDDIRALVAGMGG